MGASVRTFLGLTLLTGGFLGTLATILGFFGSTSWFFDVLANFRFHLAFGLVVTGVLYFLLFGRATALVFLVMGAVNILLVAPLYLDNPAPAASPDLIRIASFNVGAGRANPEEILEWVTDSPPDLVFLLESTEEWIAAMPTSGSGYSVGNEIPDDRAYGISVLGRNAADVEQLRLGETQDPVVRVTATIGEQAVVVYAVHPRPPDSAATAKARNSLFDELATRVADETMPVIVIGDFNATPWSSAFRKFEGDTGLVNSQRGYGLSATWPTSLPFTLVPLDHMMHSDSLTTVTRIVGPDLGSDHMPLTVEVSLAMQ
jgi:endonuclease/exonuclease/phosphatase (EEP) superfamily protein YafD